MDEFLSLCGAEEHCGSNERDSFVTAPSDITMDSTANLTNLDSFLSAKSVIEDRTDDEAPDSISVRFSHLDQTITDDIIQSKIEELDRKRKKVIGLARVTVFGSDSTKNDCFESKRGPKLVDLDFDSPLSNLKTNTSQQFCYSDNSDDEMMDRKRDLSESGKLLQKQLAKIEKEREISRDVNVSSKMIKKKPKETVLTGAVKHEFVAATVFDNFFRLKIRNPKISSSTFESYIEGHRRFKISDLKLNSAATADSWATAAVIVNRDVRKSVNGKDYIIWKLHDLKDCQDPPVTLLLFGEACKDFWKLQVGVCVALLTPQIADNDQNSRVGGDGKFKPKNTLVTLKVFKSVQVLELGFSSELGTCKGVKLDGQKCSNFVNISLSEFCVHHVMKEARKLSANRGTFNSITSHPPQRRAPNPFQGNASRTKFVNRQVQLPISTSNLACTIRPTESNTVKPLDVKTTTKAEERTKLKEIIGGRARLPGARNMTFLTDSKKNVGERIQPVIGGDSMLEFIRKQSTSRMPSLSQAPRLGTGLHLGGDVNLVKRSSQGPSTSSHDPARQRAIAILKQRKEGTAIDRKPLKRQREDMSDQVACKRSQLSSIGNKPDLEMLLKKKSLHDSEASKAQLIAVNNHLDSLEQREKVETFVTECMAVKNVKVVSCKRCGYTAQKQSELCMREGHYVTKGTAEKRFFKCGSCQKRTVAYGMMPTKACECCHENEWVRVAMKDERKVVLENEKLLLRGEERKFVNT